MSQKARCRSGACIMRLSPPDNLVALSHGRGRALGTKSRKLKSIRMKNTFKVALASALALGAVTPAAKAYVQGDLLVGFTGGSSDFIYDLGQASSLTDGETWSLGTSLGTRFGIVGASSVANGSHIFSTSFDPAQNGYAQGANYATAKANILTIDNFITVGQSRTTTPTDTTGWTFQTDQPAGTPGNTFQNNFYNPNVDVGSTAYLFDNTPNETAGTPDIFFTYDATSGTLTFGAPPVPEPSTAVLGGLGLLAFVLRCRFAKS